MLLLDTDIMIDVLRKQQSAINWLLSLPPDADFAVVGLVAMELLQGCRNRQELEKVRSDLRSFIVVWPTVADMDRALRTCGDAKLAHGTGLLDALI